MSRPSPLRRWSWIALALWACDSLDALPRAGRTDASTSALADAESDSAPAPVNPDPRPDPSPDATVGEARDAAPTPGSMAAEPDAVAAPADAHAVDARPSPDAWVCDGRCRGEAPLARSQTGVCAGLRAGCEVSTCQWADATPSGASVPNYEPVETQCDRLDNDCDGLIDEAVGCLAPCVLCNGRVEGSAATTHFAGHAEGFAGDCTAAGQAGWHQTAPLNDLTLRWTAAADCPLPEVGASIDTYPGRWVRWALDVPEPGEYLLQMKVPARAYACPPRVFAPSVRLALVEVETSRIVEVTAPVAVPPDGDTWVTVFENTPIGTATHALALFDHLPGAAPCGLAAGETVADDTPVLLVDAISHTWIRPVTPD